MTLSKNIKPCPICGRTRSIRLTSEKNYNDCAEMALKEDGYAHACVKIEIKNE